MACFAVMMILACGMAPAMAEEKVDIRPQVRDGQTIGFEMTVGMATTMNANGNQQQAGADIRIIGSVTYQKTENGQPTAAEVSIGKDSSVSQSQNGQKANLPFPLAGKVIALKRGEGGQVTVTGADDADASTVESLKKLLNIDTTMYPPRPVSIGDEWNVDPAKMPPELTANGQMKMDLKCKLLKVGEIRGRKSYDIALTGTAKGQTQPGAEMTMTFGGVLQIDVASGLPAQGDMVMKISAQGIESQIKSSVAYTFPGGAAPPPAAVGQPPANVVPPENPLDPQRPANPLIPARPPVAASPFNGSFKGDMLSGDFNVAGDQVTGAVTLNDKKYPVVGVIKDGKLTGTFEAAGAKFNFTATLDGDAMSFETDGTKYAMKKQGAANPLGRPRNPLDQ
jgi:hypothetical protein